MKKINPKLKNKEIDRIGVFINKPTYFETDIASAACFIKFEDKILFLKKQSRENFY